MSKFVVSYLPFTQVGPGGGNRNVGEVERAEHAAFDERRGNSDPMERFVRVTSEYEHVASKIQYRVAVTGIPEKLRDRLGKKPLPYRSKIKLHSRLENDFASFDSDVFKISS